MPDLQTANRLLKEAADECVWGPQIVSHDGLTPDQMRERIFRPRQGGVSCGGMSHFFVQILRENGFDAEIHVMVARHDSHATVFIRHEGRRYVFDPLYSGRYVDLLGEDMDFDRVLSGEPFKFAVNPMNRTVLTRADYAETRRLNWEKRFEIPGTWEDEPNEHGFVACHGFAYTPEFFFLCHYLANTVAICTMPEPRDIISWFYKTAQ